VVIGALAEDLGAIRERVRRAGAAGVAPSTLAAELGASPESIESRTREMESAGEARRLAGRVYDQRCLTSIGEAVDAALAAFHRAEPLSAGESRERLRVRAAEGLSQEAWRALLDEWAAGGRVRLDADKVASADHRVILSKGEQERKERIERRFLDAGLDPPEVGAVVRDVGGGDAVRLVEMLIEEGRLVRIRDGRPFHAEALRGLRERLRERAPERRRIDVATFKEMFGLTRKNAIPLLEQLDAERVTRRVGNEREILDA
jgi:selenocysteine-specific elongation factor